MFNKILTVCTGNICRSPAAAYLLWQSLEKLVGWEGAVYSAGIGALVDHPADETTQALMHAKGVDLSGHKAAQLTPEKIRQADLVLVMETHHRQCVLEMDPTARGKTFLLGHWTHSEIPDPYMRGEIAHADSLRLIEEAVGLWVEKIGYSD